MISYIYIYYKSYKSHVDPYAYLKYLDELCCDFTVTSLEWWESLSLSLADRNPSWVSIVAKNAGNTYIFWYYDEIFDGLLLSWSSDVTCSVDLLSRMSLYGRCDQQPGTWIRSHSPSWFQFCSDDTNSSMQCYHVSYVMIIYIYYISDYMCADICSDILCSRQTNTFISLHISSICAHGSIIRWRRVWRVAQGDRDPALQGVLAVKNSGEFGGNWWKWLVTQCTCEDFGGIFGPICLVIQWFGYLWHHLQWSKVGMVPGYLWIFREATRVWGCDQPLHWTTWRISSSAGFFPELANGSKIDRTPEHLMAKAMVSCTLW